MSIQRLIDGVPSEKFYSDFHYTKILKLLGYDGPAKAGAYVRCPKCKTASMLVSSLAPFEGWMYCDKCKTSCEALQLYGQAYKIANPEDLIDQLSMDLKLRDTTPEDRTLYVRFHEKYYGKVIKLWEQARLAMYPTANRLAVGRLNELNLWLNQSVFNKAFADWFGFAFKHDVEELLGEKIHGFGKAPEGLLVIPFYLKPGFICGFGFIGSKDQMSYVNMTDCHTGGFCGLNSCHKDNSSCIYVVDHPLQAARIAHKCAVERYNKISIVAKAPIGNLEPLLLPKDVVLWVDGPDTTFYKNCVKNRKFKVMGDDTPYIWKPTEKVSKMWEGSFMPLIHKRIESNNLHDPVDFLVNELITMGVVNARNLIETLELSEFQKNLLLVSCPADLQEELKDILGSMTDSQPIIIDRKVVFEKEAKLWLQGSREIGDELLCNAMVRITHICRIKQTGEAVFFGKFLFEGKEVNFQVLEHDFEIQPAKVLAHMAANAGIGKQPFIADSIVKKYSDIVLRLSSPDVYSVQNYVGFDSDTERFNLPKVSIDSSQIRVGMPFVMTETEPPCAKLTVEAGVTVKSITNIFTPGPETSVYLSAMAGVISGIYNTVQANHRTNTMLVGSKGSLAEYIFEVLRIDLGLHTLTLLHKDDLDAASALCTIHHVPVAIDGLRSNPKLLAQWLEGQASNSLVLANQLTASAMGNEKDWYFVRGDVPFKGETLELLNSENVFPFFLQYALTVRPSDAHNFLDHLRYLVKSLNLPTTVLDIARTLISHKGYVNTKSEAVQLLNFVNEGVEQGVFKTHTGADPKNKYVVIKNPMEDTVTVDLTNLLGQMRASKLPVVTWEAAVNHLRALGAREINLDGVLALVFPKPLWNTLVSAVKRMKAMRKASLHRLFTDL